MKQALHIFRKDMRGLRVEVGLVLAATLMFAWSGVMASSGDPQLDMMEPATLLLAVSWGVLAARAVHAEAPAGDRQFWLTRPYDRGSLMAAKAMLLIAAVHIPMFIAQSVILAANGFSPGEKLPGLVWEEVLLAFVLTIPAAGLASVTDSMPRFLMASLGSMAAVMWASQYAWGTDFSGIGGNEWIRTTPRMFTAGLAGLLIAWLQFRKRRTNLARGLAVAGVLGIIAIQPAMGWRVRARVQSVFNQTAPPPIRVRIDPQREIRRRDTPAGRLELPILIEGVPPGGYLQNERVVMELQLATGTVSCPGSIYRRGGEMYEMFVVRPEDEPLLRQPFSVKTTASLTYLGEPRRVELEDGAVTGVPGIGQCRANSRLSSLNCTTVLRGPERLAITTSRRGSESTFAPSYSPLPAQLMLDPIMRLPFFGTDPDAAPFGAAGVTTYRPLAHFTATWTFDNVTLPAAR